MKTQTFCPVSIDPRALAALMVIAATFVDGAPGEEIIAKAIEDVGYELEMAGHTVEELRKEIGL